MSQNQTSTECDLAVFTVPGMVAFEGQHHLLHIFEPRFRKMIEYCVEHRALLGLALPKSELGEGTNQFQKEPIKKTNYLPAKEVIGAGPVNIVKELDDGRFLIAVSIKYRVIIQETTQALPFIIARGRLTPSVIRNQTISDHTFDRLKKMSENILGEKFHAFENRVPNVIWERRDLQGLLVRVMEWFRLDGIELQKLLEEDVVEKRASRFIDVMDLYYEQVQQSAELEQERNEIETRENDKETEKTDEILNEDQIKTEDYENVIKVDFKQAR